MSIQSVMPPNQLILCRPLLLLPSIFPSIKVFSNESVLIRWSKYCGFSFSFSLSNEYLGLISFRMDWLDLLAVQGTLKSLLQHHSTNASVLRSAFFTVQLSHPYMTTGKTIALTRQTFVSKVMSLLLNMLSRLVIAFLPRSKSLNFMAAVTICSDFGAQENKICHCSIASGDDNKKSQLTPPACLISRGQAGTERGYLCPGGWLASVLSPYRPVFPQDQEHLTGLAWWSSKQDSTLPTEGAQV